MDQHELVCLLKDLALELGKTPTYVEFKSKFGKGQRAIEAIGGYTILCQMAGLTPNTKKQKIDNSIFEKSIEKHLEQYQPQPYSPPGPYPTAAIISDIHWPFSCQRVIDAFIVYVRLKKPEWVILNGDAWDMYSHSKYPRSHNIFTPRDEQRLAREMNEEFWKRVQEASPNSKCIQMMGNHDIRPLKRILEEYPEAEDWVQEKLSQLFTFKGVKTIHDPREELFLNETTIVFHGYRSKLGDHRDYTLLNCFNGHTHVGGVVWRRIRNSLLFEANSGLAGDPASKGLTYTPQKIVLWTPGFMGSEVDAPKFIPA